MKLIGKIFFPFALASLFFSCGTPIPYGYKKISEKFYYQLYSFGENDRTPTKGDYLTVGVDLLTENDTLVFSTSDKSIDGTILYRVGIKGSAPALLSCIEDGLMLMHEGDSVSFLMSADTSLRKISTRILKLSQQKMLKFNVKLYKIQDETEYETELTEKKKLLDNADIMEKLALEKYIKEKNIMTKPIANGFFFLEEKQGRGAKVESGKYITVQYKASFLNGRIFHSTYNSHPLEFTYGEQEQVIKGMEIGLSKMYEGGKAKFIISSHLAFGEKGSSTGQVPPFTTVIYEVEVINVK